MPDYDGSIRINTQIEAKNAEKELKILESSIAKTANEIASLRSKMDALKDTKIPTQEYQNLQKQLAAAEKEMERMLAQDSKLSDINAKIKSLTQSSAEYAAKMREVASQKIPTQEYTSLEKEWERLEKRLIKIGESRQRFLAGGGKEKDSSFRRMSYDMESIEQQMDSIASKMKKMEESGKAFTLGTDTDQYKNLSAKYEQINAELEKQKGIQSEIAGKQAESVQKVMELKAQMQQLVEQGKAFTLGSDTEKYAQMAAQIERLNQQMQSDTERQTELQNALAAEEERLAQIKANATVSDQNIIALLERRRQLVAEISDLERAGVGLGYKEYEDKNRELEQINAKIKEYKSNLSQVPGQFERMRNSAKKAFNAISDGTNKASFSLSGGLKMILKYGLGIRSMYILISKIRRGIVNSFKNLMGYSDSFANTIQDFKNSLKTLGNQFAATFYPIVQYVVPWLTALVNAISKAMTYVAQFIAVLGGKSTFTRAKQIQDKYNQSLNGTAKAADKARGALAKFDDLDVLEKPDSGAGGGGIEETLPKDMFEEVPVDMKLPVWLDGIIERLRELKDIFMEGFWDGLGDWESRWESIKENIASIKNVILEIATNAEVLGAVWKVIESTVKTIGTILGSVFSVILTIIDAVTGGIAKFLEQNKDKIEEFIITISNIITEINELISKVAVAIAYVFEAFSSEQAQQLIADILGIIFAVSGVVEFVYKLFRDLLEIVILPFIENADKLKTTLEGLISFLEQILSTIKKGLEDTFAKLNEIYDEHFKPFFDSIAEGLSELVGTFLEVWNTYIQPILDIWAEKFDVLWAEHIQPMIDNFLEMLGSLADLLTWLWEEILQPQLEWFIDVFGPTFGDIFDFVVSVVSTAVTLISDMINGIVKIVKGVIDILMGLVKGDWQKVWDGFTKVIEGAKTITKGVVNSIIGIVESLANAVVAAVNTVIRALNNLHIDVPDWVTQLTGITDFGFNLSEISKIEIPRLATGAVIRGGNPFMAILGDQPAGKTNIEAPADLIKDMVKKGIAESGYGQQQSLPVTINLNYDGETFARLSISDILSELGRQGYDVDVLGAT